RTRAFNSRFCLSRWAMYSSLRRARNWFPKRRAWGMRPLAGRGNRTSKGFTSGGTHDDHSATECRASKTRGPAASLHRGGRLWYSAAEGRTFPVDKARSNGLYTDIRKGKETVMAVLNAFGSRGTLDTGQGQAVIYRLDSLEKAGVANVSRLPFSLRVLLESLLRHCDGYVVTQEQVEALARWRPGQASEQEIGFMPARVLLQDFTGVPAVVDLTAMRDAI